MIERIRLKRQRVRIEDDPRGECDANGLLQVGLNAWAGRGVFWVTQSQAARAAKYGWVRTDSGPMGSLVQIEKGMRDE